MDGVAFQLKQLESIVRSMMREVESYGTQVDFFQRMAAMRFAANDVICNLYVYGQESCDCFATEGQRYRFNQNIDRLKRHFVNHQSRWSNEEIKRDREGYIISSALAAQNFYAWIDEMRADVNPEEYNGSAWSKFYAKVVGL